LCQDPTGVCDQILIHKFWQFLPWFFWGVACDVTMGLSIDGSHAPYLVLQFSSLTLLQVSYICVELFCPNIPKTPYQSRPYTTDYTHPSFFILR